MNKLNESNKLLLQYLASLFTCMMIGSIILRLFAKNSDPGILVAIVFVSAVINARWLIKKARNIDVKD